MAINAQCNVRLTSNEPRFISKLTTLSIQMAEPVSALALVQFIKVSWALAGTCFNELDSSLL